jgi:acetoin utilization deacetylase AcuC-like enzyme
MRTPGTEVPQRMDAILAATMASGAQHVAAAAHGDDILDRVHDRALLDYLRRAWDGWVAAGFPDGYGQDRVVPYVFPLPGLLGSLPTREPAAAHARAGRYCYDTMTLVGPGTWRAARAAVDVALTAVDAVVAGSARCAYALCRPPGHHASRTGFGGSCYLNNAAVAAEALLAAGVGRVAVVDIDAHHGNGTQALFYDRADVFYGSVHVDPAAGWFPHYVGFADERGEGAGSGANRNVPLAPGTGDAGWLAGVSQLVDEVAAHRCDAAVVSLGVDAARADPESPLDVSADAFRAAGELVGGLGVPVVAVQEGGYVLDTLGALVVATLEGIASARSAA